MNRPSEVNALVERLGYRDAATEGEGGWWSSCPVPTQNGSGPVFCGERLFVAYQQDGSGRYEPTCAHTADEVTAAVTTRVSVDPLAGAKGRRLVLTDLAGVRPRPVRWLWQDRIPLGVPSLLAGKPKLGKSTLAYDLAAKLTTGTLDGDLGGEPSSVLVVTFEDLVAETVVPRLIAAGADLSRVRTIEVEHDGERDLVSLPDDVPQIEEAAIEHGVRLLIVDPLMAALTGGTDSHRDSQVRRVLAPLAKLAERNDLAVLTIMHLNKGQGADLIGRIGGSVAFTGAARSLLVFGADPSDPDGEDGSGRVLAQRGNLAKRAASLAYRIEGRIIDGPDGPIETSKLVCLGESDARADELLAAVTTSEERTERDDAAEFLRVELEDGPRPARDVKASARDAGISERTLARAKSQLGVRSERVGESGRGGGHWEWSLRLPPPAGTLKESGVGTLNANPHQERDSGPTEALRLPTKTSGTLNRPEGWDEATAEAEIERLERKRAEAPACTCFPVPSRHAGETACRYCRGAV